MEQIQAFLAKEIFAVNGFRLTVGMVVLALVAVYIIKRMR